MSYDRHDQVRAGYALMAAYVALQDEIEPRKLMVAAKATRSIAPVLARSLIAKARHAVYLRQLLLEPDQQSA